MLIQVLHVFSIFSFRSFYDVVNALFILLLPVGLALKIPFFLHSRGLHPLRWPTIRRYSQCLEPVVVVPPSLKKYRHFSQVLFLFLLISASVNSDQLFFITSPSVHRMCMQSTVYIFRFRTLGTFHCYLFLRFQSCAVCCISGFFS